MQPYPAPPQFTNPWSSTASTSHLFSAPSSSSSSSTSTSSSSSFIPPPIGLDAVAKQRAAVPMPYTTLPTTAPSMSASGMGVSYTAPPPLLNLPQDLLSAPRISNESSYGAEQTYSTTASSSPSPHPQTYVPTSTSFDTLPFPSTRTMYPSSAQASVQTSALASQQAAERRLSSQTPISSASSFISTSLDGSRARPTSMAEYGRGMATSQASRDGFGDAIDSGRGMVGITVGVTEDDDVTPRNIYGGQSRECTDSYGFPSTHSSSSSISSASTYPSYYGSMDSSLSEYSSTSESVDGLSSRTLPRPAGLVGGGSLPPAPQSMMSQFNSKVSSSGQKKHKCKICDKRFTRPSSLQTHMYSHTGEKPFCCEVEGCGRHFSVVSNLRRHRKVHRGERETSSPDDL